MVSVEGLMSGQHLHFWETAGLEPPRAKQSVEKRSGAQRGSVRGAVLTLNRRFLVRAGIAACAAVAAETAVTLLSTTFHVGAVATFVALALAVLTPVIPLVRTSG